MRPADRDPIDERTGVPPGAAEPAGRERADERTGEARPDGLRLTAGILPHDPSTVVDAVGANAVEGIVVTDPHDRIAWVNAAAAGALGYTPDEVVGRSIFEVVPAGIRPVLEVHAIERRAGRSGRYVLPVTTPDGGPRTIEVSSTPLLDESGAFLGAVALMSDVTQQRRTADELRQREDSLRAIAEAVPFGVFDMAADGSVEYANPYLIAIYRLWPIDGPRADFLAQVHPDDRPRCIEQWQAIQRDREPVTIRYRIDVGGRMPWFECQMVPVLGEHGEVARVVGTLREVDAEVELAHHLRAARDRALEASRLKSHFLATVSHEVRTPLNGIVGLTELLLATVLDQEQRDLGESLRASAASLTRLLGHLLGLSAIEAGELRIEPVPFDLAAVVREAAEGPAALAEAKGVRLAVHGADAPLPVLGPADHLATVLGELVDNAVRFTSTGAVDAVVEVLDVDDDRLRVRIEVADTGRGLSGDEIGRALEPFGATRGTDPDAGSGLGLALAGRLVEVLGSRLEVDSHPGTGTRFWFVLDLDTRPAHDAHDAGDAGGPDHRSAAPGAAAATTIRTEPPRVLLAEDNAVNQRVAAAVLERLGCVVDLAADGEEAVAAGAARTYDAILMDCQMPRLDGFDATRALRADSPNASTPIIAVTAGATAADREHAALAGMDDYLTKPFTIRELADLLERHGVALPASAPPPAAPGEAVLDEARLAEYAAIPGADGLRLLDEVVEVFTATVPPLLDRLQIEVGAGDLDRARWSAHELQAAAAGLGAPALAAAAARVRDACADGSATRAATLLPAVGTRLATTLTAVESRVRR
ncbi:MAG: response regulator [Acidimicrobiales bacterium]